MDRTRLTESESRTLDRLILDANVYHVIFRALREGAEFPLLSTDVVAERYGSIMRELDAIVAKAEGRPPSDHVDDGSGPFPSLLMGSNYGWFFPSRWPPGHPRRMEN